MRTMWIISLLVFMVTSCFEEDIMVIPHEQGDLEVGVAEQGPTYGLQVYFDLYYNTEVSSNLVSDWDLSFESSPGGWLIRLNSSKFMLAGNSQDTTFNTILNESGLEMKFDKSDGDPDSTAIGEWFLVSGDTIRSKKEVYLIDLGRDEQNSKLGYKKVRFEVLGDDYLIRHADKDNSRDTTVVIRRDDNKWQIHYSFDEGIVNVAPDQVSWSLLFSRYTTMLQTNDGENYPYLVTGVLLNPLGVAAALDTIHEFSSIVLADTAELELTTRADIIGYDWKYYNFNAGIYTIVPEFNYVIRDRDGFYYKLRFIDFYNDTGDKGYPRFEYIRL